MPPVNQALCSAIRSRELVRFYYNGGIRTVEPHCYGLSAAGPEPLRGYQIGGYSETGEPIGWKLFQVSKMSSLSVMDERFTGPRPSYNPDDSAMEVIFCQL